MSQGDRFTYSSAPVRKVKAVQFGILDPDFIVSLKRRFSLLCYIFDFLAIAFDDNSSVAGISMGS